MSGRGSLANPDIVLVEINDTTIRDLGHRRSLAVAAGAVGLLVDYLHRGSPRVIALDVDYWEREREGVVSLQRRRLHERTVRR